MIVLAIMIGKDSHHLLFAARNSTLVVSLMDWSHLSLNMDKLREDKGVTRKEEKLNVKQK